MHREFRFVGLRGTQINQMKLNYLKKSKGKEEYVNLLSQNDSYSFNHASYVALGHDKTEFAA